MIKGTGHGWLRRRASRQTRVQSHLHSASLRIRWQAQQASSARHVAVLIQRHRMMTVFWAAMGALTVAGIVHKIIGY